MAKYENETWKLLNVEDLPRIDISKNKINHKKCVGMTLVFKHKGNNQEYKIKITDYIEGYRDENGRTILPKF